MKSAQLLAALAPLLIAAAPEEEPGTRKAGNWQLTITGPDGKPAPPKTLCLPATSLTQGLKHMDSCSKSDFSKEGDATTLDAVCTRGKMNFAFHTVITSPDEDTYHAETHSVVTTEGGPARASDVVTDGKWLGPCEPEAKPGK